MKAVECRIIVIRHGSREGNDLPNDCISQASYCHVKDIGRALRERGIVAEKIYTSPRGRAVQTAVAFGTGNANSTVAPFETVKQLRDVSSDNPAVIGEVNRIAETEKITTEEAVVLVTDPAAAAYLARRIIELADFLQSVAARCGGQTVAVCGHGGLIEPAIELIRRPKAAVPKGLKANRYLNKGEALELVFRTEQGAMKLIKVRYDFVAQ